MIYDYITTKPPLNNETLAHYGIKGMKWRRRKNKTIDKKTKERIVAEHLADEVVDGKRKQNADPYNIYRKGYVTKEYLRSVMNYRPDGKHSKAVLANTYKSKTDSFGTQKTTTKKKYDKALRSAIEREAKRLVNDRKKKKK